MASVKFKVSIPNYNICSGEIVSFLGVGYKNIKTQNFILKIKNVFYKFINIDLRIGQLIFKAVLALMNRGHEYKVVFASG